MIKPPELHPNFFLACLQLIFWVFFKPITLLEYTGTLIPGFKKNFSLWSARKQSNPRLNRFLKLQFVAMIIAPYLITFPLILLSQWAAIGEINLLKAAFGVAGEVSGIADENTGFFARVPRRSQDLIEATVVVGQLERRGML